MVEVLHTWIGREYVGHFEKAGPQHRANFVYDEGALQSLSLSVPIDGTSFKRAPQNFLNGLIPEDPATRESMRAITNARSGGSWDLLCAIEGDLPGGIQLHPDREGIDRGVGYTRVASMMAVSSRVAEIIDGGTGYGDFDAPPRFSLAGAQSKFALVMTDEGNYWPDAATPSTHIVKPTRRALAGLDEIEAVSLELASRIPGLEAADAEVRWFGGVPAFVVRRFDREVRSDGSATRLHVEDVAQALGRNADMKYRVSVPQVVRLLRTHGVTDDVQYDFVRQLAFNVAIGNSDAHAKNYSLMHLPGGKVRLSPMYDTVPIGMFPHYEQKLGMRVGNHRYAKGISPGNWIYLAKRADLDPDRVLSVVREVSEGVLDHIDDTIGNTMLGAEHREIIDLMKRTAERNAASPTRSPSAPKTPKQPSHSPGGRARRGDHGSDETSVGALG